jgi:Protein of unknown function (DUF3570)
MQLRLAVVLLALALPVAARADDSFTAKTQVYTDSDHTTVVSPLTAISRDAWQGGTVSASYVADIVSSASVDVISNATKRMTDFRSEISAGLAQKLRSATFTGSYVYSVENDYSSHNVDFGLAQDLFERNSTLSIGYSVSSNSIGRTGDHLFHRSLLVNGVSASWSQVIDKRTIAQLSYSFAYNDGYQASPYRFVRIEASDLNSVAFKVPESDPNDRYRHAFVLALNRHLFTDTSLQGDYRFYVDNWGVQAQTVQLRYFVTFGDVTLRLRERFYYQKGARFFQTHYTTESFGNFVTADRELSTFWSNLVGAKVSWRLPWVHRALELEAKVDYFHFSYLDFALLTARNGANIEAGINVIY